MNLWYQGNIDSVYMFSKEEFGEKYYDYGNEYRNLSNRCNGIYTLNEDEKTYKDEKIKEKKLFYIRGHSMVYFKKSNYSLLDSPAPTVEVSSDKYGKNFKVKSKNPQIISEMIDKTDKDLVSRLLTIGNEGNPVKEEYVDWYIKRWAAAKYEYYIAMGNKLKVSKKVDIQMSDIEISRTVNEIVKKYRDEKRYILLRVKTEEWRSNKISPDSNITNDKKCIGMKVSKFLSKKFEDPEYDIDISKVFQNMRKKGSIVISVDPVDYLTMSVVDSSHGWISCYHIKPGSGWANCSPALMIDESSIVIYRDNEKTYNFEINGIKFDWNSKQIRWIVFVDKETSSVAFSRPMGNPSQEFINQMESFFIDTFWKDIKIIYRDTILERISFKRTGGYHHFGDDTITIYAPYQLADKHVKFHVGNRKLICPSNGKYIKFSYKNGLYIEDKE